ncbi:MAG: hypothetical protein OXN93_09155 [bacterium]|nr:hypothetical protein [bacterium]
MEDRSDLLVFIDLSFVLLVGFLILTETAPRVNVVLPEKTEQSMSSEDDQNIFNLRFDGSSRFTIDDGKNLICNPQGLQALVTCMNEQENGTYILIPEDVAPVQLYTEIQIAHLVRSKLPT